MKSLLLLSVASVVTASSSVHIPLIRRSPAGFFTPEDLAAQRDALDSKYHRGGGATVRPRQNVAGVPMVNQNGDLSYYALMNVGTPPTAYGVALGCEGAKIKSGSSSLQQTGRPFAIRYGSGAVQGAIVSDHIEMGGFAIQNQVMGLVNQTSGVLLNGNSAGLFGLAFQMLSNTQSIPFWEALVTGGQWSQPLMSFWMTRFTNISTVRNEEYGGEFRMGGLNASLYTGEIEYINMPSSIKAYWSIPLRQITVNGGSPMIITNLGVTSLAAIDTGTSLIGGPSDIVADIYRQIPNAQRGTGNLERYWIYPCSQEVNVAFNFGGRNWSIESADFKLLTTNPNVCVGAIFEMSLGGLGNPDVPQWIVGDAFLKNVYSVFRYEPPSVGFAQLSAAATGGQPIPTSPLASSASAPIATATNAVPNATEVSNGAASAVSSASLVRRGNSHPTFDFAAERKGLQEKYGGKHQSKSHVTRQNIVQEDMVNQNMDTMYYASVEVGTPPQSYAVILDTGSSDMWLQSVDCAPCTGKKINSTSSSTLQHTSSPFSIAYGIGSVKGMLVNDVVSIGSSSAFTIQNQVWGLVNYTLGTPVPGDIAGLMGLGFKNLAASQATPFWEALVADNKWHEPVMSFWMTRYNNISTASAAEFGGEFLLGGTNEALYTGDIEFISLPYASNPTFWAIPIHTITVNGNEVSAIGSNASSALAAIDTATTLIGGPAGIVANLYAAIPGAQRGSGVLEGYWTFLNSKFWGPRMADIIR
ncbi:unnamed protein product [Rhizoctonia solani]|uniref:Peptidase A1 domain-containing protein n=1 Tax=Rhizoctonia solani TaxID=456999 RepID=A0A8H3D4T3_9AGAM|nr:unnamed protein product [Rhizoctonia solani]